MRVSRSHPRNLPRNQWIVLGLLGILAAISLGRGCLNAMANSGDFQWSGTHLILRHIDPWHQYLLGDPGRLFIGLQLPNYLPLLYVMLAPLGVMPFNDARIVWLLLNIGFAVGSALLCGRYYGLAAFGNTVLVLLFLISTPARNSLGLGQQSFLVLFLWTIALCRPPRFSGALTLSLSYFKYSFAPPAFFFLLFEMGPVAALVGILPVVATFLLVYLWLGGSLLDPASMFALFVSPLKVARTGYFGAPGPNLMDLAEYALKTHNAPSWLTLTGGYIFPILLTGALLYLISRQPRRLHRPERLALLAILSVCLLKHHGYDHVLLLFPAAYALAHWKERVSRIILGLLIFPWFAERLLDPFVPAVVLNVFSFVLLILMAIALYVHHPAPTDQGMPA